MNRVAHKKKFARVMLGLCAAALLGAATGALGASYKRAMSSRDAWVVDSREATRRLSNARMARDAGTEPVAGELQQAEGDDAPRVNARYWRRQEQLRIEVERAQRRSNETQRRP